MKVKIAKPLKTVAQHVRQHEPCMRSQPILELSGLAGTLMGCSVLFRQWLAQAKQLSQHLIRHRHGSLDFLRKRRRTRDHVLITQLFAIVRMRKDT